MKIKKKHLDKLKSSKENHNISWDKITKRLNSKESQEKFKKYYESINKLDFEAKIKSKETYVG